MNMPPTYCYWSVATGTYAGLMERCVESARDAGVFKEFHVMTDRPVKGAESYDAYEVELTDKLFKLVYLKAAISKLNFDYYVWLDADTVFQRNPRNLLTCLSRSPIHMPLEVNLSAVMANVEAASPKMGRQILDVLSDTPKASDRTTDKVNRFVDPNISHPRLHGLSIREYVGLFAAAGVSNPVYWSRSAFWIVRRTAIERLCELVLYFRAFAKERGITVDVSDGLSYAMQMLCADPAKHERSARPDLWAGQDDAVSDERTAGPALLHLSCSEQTSDGSGSTQEPKEEHELLFD